MWNVTAQESGTKLLSFISHHLNAQVSAKQIKRMIERGCCQVNGRTERFASTLVGQGDQVFFQPIKSDPPPSKLEHERILFEDEALLLYNKPALINSDENGLLKILSIQFPHLKLVHRLDRETSGVIILAKQERVFENLVEQFRQFFIHKDYLAIVDGVPAKQSGIIENYLGKKQAYAGQTLWGAVKPAQGLYACTSWQRLKVSNQEASLLVCSPKTGRTHQIRVHLAGMGHPILGDHQYAKHFRCAYSPSRCLLHASAIRFKHPLSNKEIIVKAPIPADFSLAEQKLFSEKLP